MPSRVRWPLIVLVLLALAMRIGFLVHDPHPYADSGLAADSAELARQIDDHGRWFESNLTAASQLGNVQNQEQRLVDPASLDFRAADAHPQLQPNVLQPIGESIVLAALWKMTGEHWLPYQLLMIAIGALMTPLVFYISLSLFGRVRAAYLGALLYAVFPPVAWLATIPHLDAWAVDLTIVTAALLVRARAAERPLPWLIGAGVAAGLGSYFRPGLLLIAPVLGLALLGRGQWRRALRLAAVPTLVAALLLVPWTIRNAEVFHRFIPTRVGIGQNLWEGLGEVQNSFGAVLDDAATYRQVHASHPNLVYGSPAYDSLLESWGLRAIRQHPGFYAKLVAKRMVDTTVLLRNTDWAGNILSPAQSGLSLTRYIRHRFGDFVILMLEPLLFVLSALTVLVTLRRYGRAHLVLAAIVVATLLPYLFLHVEPRYILPASFTYLIWTALGLDLLIARTGSRRRRRPADAGGRERRVAEPTAFG